VVGHHWRRGTNAVQDANCEQRGTPGHLPQRDECCRGNLFEIVVAFDHPELSLGVEVQRALWRALGQFPQCSADPIHARQCGVEVIDAGRPGAHCNLHDLSDGELRILMESPSYADRDGPPENVFQPASGCPLAFRHRYDGAAQHKLPRPVKESNNPISLDGRSHENRIVDRLDITRARRHELQIGP
jgi:hypothetical protein